MDALIAAILQPRHHGAGAAADLAGLGRPSSSALSVVPLGLCGGLVVALLGSRAFARRCVSRWRPDRLLPRRAAAGAADFRLCRAAVCRPAALAFRSRLPSRFSSIPRAYYGEIYRAGIESVGAGQWDAARSTGLTAVAGAGLRRHAASGAQRAAGSGVEHRGGGEAHLARERGRAAGDAVFGRHGALGDLQFVADRAGRRLIYLAAAVAGGAARSAGWSGRYR